MSIKMFLEFPGVLITIGIALLILAIIIGIIAYKSEEKEEFDEIDNEEKDNVISDVAEATSDSTSLEEGADTTLVNPEKKEEAEVMEDSLDVTTDGALEESEDVSNHALELELKQEEMYKPVGTVIANSQPVLEDEEEEIELL